MSWKVDCLMSIRQEFVLFATERDANIAALCRRFKVSRKTGYKWLSRHRTDPADALADRSRRPKHSPGRTDAAVEEQVVALRAAHPAWGARKLKRRLEDLGRDGLPARSTVHGILLRRGLIDAGQSAAHTAHQRFERHAPNELWQMDFKGHFATAAGRCHPLTVLDDHSRFNLVLSACVNEQLETVKQALIDAMRLYGMPLSILCDNGPPWGSFGADGNWTTLAAWLIRRGVGVAHGRPLHPQTQGKDERFHRTLKAEAIGTRVFRDLPHCQEAFDAWREVYNQQRPHEALDLAVPISRYSPSDRTYPETPPPVEYGPGDQVRKVTGKGCVSYGGQSHRVGYAFVGERVALRPTPTETVMEVFYCHQRIAQIDLCGESVTG